MIKLLIFFTFHLSIYGFWYFYNLIPTPPPNTNWDFTRTKQGEKKEYTPFLPESNYESSIRGLAQLEDEKSN